MPVEHIQFVARELLSRADFLIPQWLPDGKRLGHEWVARNPTRQDAHLGSFKVNLATGVWCDFATGDKGGDVVSLYAYLEGVKQGEAAERLAETHGLNDKPYTASPGAKGKVMWEPLIPIPANAPPPPQAHPKHGKSSCSWTYRNERGAVLCYVLRFDLKGKDGKPVLDKHGKQEKEFAPLTFCLNATTGQTAWRWQALPSPRPLYNLDKLVANPQATVIICEGEKSSDACLELFPECVITTTLNGAQSPHKTDLTPLADRTVWLWPDTGEPGRRYAEVVTKLARKVGAREVKLLHVPGDHPSGWDAADALAEGWQNSREFQLVDINPMVAKESEAAAQETDAEIIARLAKLPPIEYDRVRNKEADRLGVGVRVTTLDCEVAKARSDDAENDARGTAVEFEAVEPWGESVDGVTLLNDLAATFKQYLVLPKDAELILALWVVHTYAIDLAHATPYLNITSPLLRCGKSKLLDLLEALVYRHLKFSNTSSAAIFRVVEAHHPTLLIDEADTYIKDNEDLRGILNDGYRPGGKVLRAVPSGDDFEPRLFSVWGAKAIAGIGKLPRTIEDRSITICMKRKTKSEITKRLRLRTIRDDLLPLRRRITRWVKDNAGILQTADPDTPEVLNDRTAEVCEILFAIAEAVGGKWPEHAKQAIIALSGAGNTEDELKSVQLLADLRQLFKERNTDRLSSEEIVNALIELEDRPWAEYRKGQPITKNGVARLLKPFDIRPGALRFSDGRAGCSGYDLSWFLDAFTRYLDNSGNQTSTTQQTGCDKASSDFSNLNKDKNVEVEKPPKPAPDNKCWSVEVENTENGVHASNDEKRGEVMEGLEGDIEGNNSPEDDDSEIDIVDGEV